jgi:hypothetical protein
MLASRLKDSAPIVISGHFFATSDRLSHEFAAGYDQYLSDH